MKISLLTAALTLGLAAPAVAQQDGTGSLAPLFTENGVLGVAWGTDRDDLAAIFRNSLLVLPSNVDDYLGTDKTEFASAHKLKVAGHQYRLNFFALKGQDGIVMAEISGDSAEQCAALESHFTANLGEGKANSSARTDSNGSYSATTRIWVDGPVVGNRYGYVYIPANASDPRPFCLAVIADETKEIY